MGTGEEKTVTETEIKDKDIKAGDVLHICYHDEGNGKPCELKDG